MQDVSNFFLLFFNFIFSIVNLLNTYTFTAFGVEVSYFGMFMVTVILMMLVSIFWKGARA